MMSKNTDVRARVPDQLKQQAIAVLASKNITISEGINAFLQAVVEKKGMPFAVEKKPSLMLAKRMRDTRKKFAEWDKRYNKGKDL